MLHVFGDSLSDIGRLKSLTFGLIPPAVYWNGRFSSGPVWNEYLALLLNANLDNHAVGLAKAWTVHHKLLGVFPLEPPASYDQITEFADKTSNYSSTKLNELDIAILEIGANDAQAALVDISKGTQTVYEFAQYLSDTVIEQLQMIYKIGFKNILVLGLPALQHTPIVIAKNRANVAEVLVNVYNKMLSDKSLAWAQSANLKMFDVVDLDRFMRVSLDNSITQALKVVNTISYCINGSWLALFEDHTYASDFINFVFGADSATSCPDPSALYFFDPIHPSEQIQRLFGYYLFKHIQALQRGLTLPSISVTTLLDIIQAYKLHLPVSKPVAI
ncbi:hypothetical protein IWW46_003645 [Coemansia sp. RSA 2440]|nr:hypothetical protein IWW46_003645 [Coemansia sp. RSA 2440]